MLDVPSTEPYEHLGHQVRRARERQTDLLRELVDVAAEEPLARWLRESADACGALELAGGRDDEHDDRIEKFHRETASDMNGPDRDGPFDVVTGAFGYTGRYITGRLLESGRSVRTLTGHPNRPNPFGDRVDVAPFDFEDRRKLAGHLRGAATLFNTYWVRFPRGDVTFERAVANSESLIQAANDAGVRRIVHVSITNPSKDSPYAYFRGKARVEQMIRDSGIAYSIVRPTVVFGREDILINNIAYVLRRVPVFGIPGSGSYRLRPVSVEDVADICARSGRAETDEVVDAVGPETFTFEELVRLIARTIGAHRLFVHVPPVVALTGATVVGRVVGDVVVTRDELDGLMAELVTTDGPATGTRRLSEWLVQNAHVVGRRYASEVSRHYRSPPPPADHLT